MQKILVIVDNVKNQQLSTSKLKTISSADFLAGNFDKNYLDNKNVKVINLCSDYEYLSNGYYCSLLAEARSQKCIPSVSNIIKLNKKRIYQDSLEEINIVLNHSKFELSGDKNSESYIISFGRTQNKKLSTVARKIFDKFRFPLVEIKIMYKRGKLVIDTVSPISFKDLNPKSLKFLSESLNEFSGSRWQNISTEEAEFKYWLAILHDKNEKLAPSDLTTLKKFVTIGKKLNMYVELIEKKDLSSLLEFDALFIRETSSVESHTYRFARKAHSEGMPCIDDINSILRCCNKVFLHELFAKNNIPTPKTCFLYRKQNNDATVKQFNYPFILKIPDGSFSRGVFKIKTEEEFLEKSKELFEETEIILIQEFVPTDYDWRVLTLNGKALVVCKYFMAKDHWQIVNNKKKKVISGDHKTFKVENSPANLIKLAEKVSKLVGSGLYGVDIKEINGKLKVMEVNDNPSINHGVEDLAIKDELYEIILKHFISMIDA